MDKVSKCQYISLGYHLEIVARHAALEDEISGWFIFRSWNIEKSNLHKFFAPMAKKSYNNIVNTKSESRNNKQTIKIISFKRFRFIILESQIYFEFRYSCFGFLIKLYG